MCNCPSLRRPGGKSELAAVPVRMKRFPGNLLTANNVEKIVGKLISRPDKVSHLLKCRRERPVVASTSIRDKAEQGARLTSRQAQTRAVIQLLTAQVEFLFRFRQAHLTDYRDEAPDEASLLGIEQDIHRFAQQDVTNEHGGGRTCKPPESRSITSNDSAVYDIIVTQTCSVGNLRCGTHVRYAPTADRHDVVFV